MLTKLRNLKKTYRLGAFDAFMAVLLPLNTAASVFDGSHWATTAVWAGMMVSFTLLIAARSAVSSLTPDFRHLYRRGSVRVICNGRWNARTVRAVHTFCASMTIVCVGVIVGKHITASWTTVPWVLFGLVVLVLSTPFLMAEYVEPGSGWAELERYRDEGWEIINTLNNEHPDLYDDIRTRVMVQKFINLAGEKPYTPAGLEATISMTAHVVTALSLELKEINHDADN